MPRIGEGHNTAHIAANTTAHHSRTAPHIPSLGWLAANPPVLSWSTCALVVLCCRVVLSCGGVQQVAALCADNRSLTVRFQHACEARHRAEKKVRAAVQASEREELNSSSWLR